MEGKNGSSAMKAVYNTDPNVPEEIESYMHCMKCIEEWKLHGRGKISPREYGRTQVGIRPDGNLQVVCTRHNCNVAVISFVAA